MLFLCMLYADHNHFHQQRQVAQRCTVIQGESRIHFAYWHIFQWPLVSSSTFSCKLCLRQITSGAHLFHCISFCFQCPPDSWRWYFNPKLFLQAFLKFLQIWITLCIDWVQNVLYSYFSMRSTNAELIRHSHLLLLQSMSSFYQTLVMDMPWLDSVFDTLPRS